MVYVGFKWILNYVSTFSVYQLFEEIIQHKKTNFLYKGVWKNSKNCYH